MGRWRVKAAFGGGVASSTKGCWEQGGALFCWHTLGNLQRGC